MKRLFAWIWKYLKPFTNWRLLISFGLAWLITNGWCYIFIGIGLMLKIDWMFTAGTAYLAFLWLPITPEKLITIPFAIFIHWSLFRNDIKTHTQLNDMYAQAKSDWNKVKFKVRLLFRQIKIKTAIIKQRKMMKKEVKK